MEIDATAASDMVSRLPSERADIERCENDVFKASKRLTTIFINYLNKQQN